MKPKITLIPEHGAALVLEWDAKDYSFIRVEAGGVFFTAALKDDLGISKVDQILAAVDSEVFEINRE